MQQSERASEPSRVVPALVLLDFSFKPVSYNEEAIRILTYTSDSKMTSSITSLMETQLRSILAPVCLPASGGKLVEFRSGRRNYVASLVPLSHQRHGSSDGDSSIFYGLLLDRRPCTIVDISLISEQFRLTPRERETLRLLATGLTTTEIGERMDISPHTVKAFCRLIMSKMQVSSRSGIIGKLFQVSR